MEEIKLIEILKEMYTNASPGEQVANIHLFGIKYAKELENKNLKRIATGATGNESYQTEISKGKKLYPLLRNADILREREQLDVGINRKIKNINLQNNKLPLNQILYGPPGTGKTYHTINKALEICGENLSGKSREEIKQRYQELVEEGRIVFTTFHQSMSYEDFVEGIKPKTDEETKSVTYEIEDGILKKLSLNAKTNSLSNFNQAFDKFIEELAQLESEEYSENEPLLKELITPIPTKKKFYVSLNSNENLSLFTSKNKNYNGVITREKL